MHSLRARPATLISNRPRSFVVLVAFCLILLSGPAFAEPQELPGVRTPLGVFAHVEISKAIDQLSHPAPPADVLHYKLRSLYARLLANPAVSGITAGAHWSLIGKQNPSCVTSKSCTVGTDGNDWSYLDDVFAEAKAANKSVQLIITPGVDSPPWLFVSSLTTSCDTLEGFTGVATAPFACDWVTFATFPESTHGHGHKVPLPWSGTYISQWTLFLQALNTQYGTKPAFVAIALAGPNVGSTEIIFPSADNNSIKQGADAKGGLVAADAAWKILLQNQYPTNAAYQNSDQAFIDAWQQTITLFEATFSGVTLFISPDNGNNLPNFIGTPVPVATCPTGTSIWATVHCDNTQWAVNCASNVKNPVSCEAKTEILSYLGAAVCGPPPCSSTSNIPSTLYTNAKASQVGGMRAGSPVAPGNIDVPGIKVLTSQPPPKQLPLILGGAEFDHAVSDPKDIQEQGCPSFPTPCPDLTPEEATYNTLTVFFYGTPAAANYGGKTGTARVEWLDVEYTDIEYAMDHPCPPNASKTLHKTSLQDLLNLASRDLFAIADEEKKLPPATCQK